MNSHPFVFICLLKCFKYGAQLCFANIMVIDNMELNLYLYTPDRNETACSPLLVQRHYMQSTLQYHCTIYATSVYQSTNNQLCVSSEASVLAAVSDLNAVVCLLALAAQHVNITLSSVAPSYSHPPQTQAIMLFTLCQALPRTMTLFLLEVT